MTKILNFGVLGGDKRQIALANSLKSDGHNVLVCGFDKCQEALEPENVDINVLSLKSDYILLPIPISRNEESLNAPFSNETILINDKFADMLKEKIIFCAMSDNLIKICDKFKTFKLYDYAKEEDFAKGNAVPTAKAAIKIAEKELNGSINGASCLVCGFGRIGKAIVPMLKKTAANITVSARKLNDILIIKELNCKSILTSDIYKTSGYDVIFNTIPHLIFNYETLKNSAKGSIIIDLASMPGGVNTQVAKDLNIKVIHALGLPGKFDPKTAGKVIKEVIYKMIKEDNL